MRLYHGTNIKAALGMVANGLTPHADDDAKCVYGFATREEAEDFALNQGFCTLAVVRFDVESAEPDPEYAGSDIQAYRSTEPAENEVLVWAHDNGETFDCAVAEDGGT